MHGGATGALAAEANPSPDQAAQSRFNVHEYRVLGNTVLPVREIETVLYPRLGDSKTITDVEAARAALENAYHARGFGTVFVDIVAGQDVSDGIVRLRATEGRINQTTVSGARYFSERNILKAMPAATPGTVPNIPELQRQLGAVNSQTPDRAVQPVLRAGPVPGTVDLGLKVNDHLPFHGSIELNNQYTPDTKPLRATVSLTYANAFAEMDSLSAQYQDTPQQPGQVGVFAASYAVHPLGDGIRPSLYFIDSNSSVSTIGTVGVLGKGELGGVRLAVPLRTNEASTQQLTFGVDYKHFRQSIGLEAGGELETPISYVLLSAAYGGFWKSERQLGAVTLGVNFGPRGIANDPNAFENDRYQARANFFYLRGDAQWTWTLPLALRLTTRLAGQWTREPLVSNEDYSIAGFDGVRGYLEAEVLGDSALKGTVQLQSPTLRLRSVDLGDAFAFFDDGSATLLQALPGQQATFNLRSYGAGIDLLPGHALFGTLTWTVPIVDGPRTRANESRYLFLIRGTF
jgi:hemolysin activation/secretion protein